MEINRTTYDDVDISREDSVRLLETLENDPRMEPSANISYAELASLEDPTATELENALGIEINEKEDKIKDSYPGIMDEIKRGGEAIMVRKNSLGSVWGSYGPVPAEEGKLFKGYISFNGDIEGDEIFKKHFQIIENNQAVYLDGFIDNEREMMDHVRDCSLGTFDVPTNYDEDKLQKSYETAINRIDRAQELQELAKNSIEDFKV